MTDTSRSAELDPEDVAILALERQWFCKKGSKHTAIRNVFGWSETRYAQRLNALLDNPAAEAADPQTVHRLQRLRDRRKRARSSRR